MRSALKTTRAASVGLVIVGLLVSYLEYPGYLELLIAAWLMATSVLFIRILGKHEFISAEGARDIFTMGMISVLLLRNLHWPGSGFALGVALIGGLALFYFERDSFIPRRTGNGLKPWLFYLSIVLVLAGTLFRIQHWPYSSALLYGGLISTAIWFFTSMKTNNGEA